MKGIENYYFEETTDYLASYEALAMRRNAIKDSMSQIEDALCSAGGSIIHGSSAKTYRHSSRTENNAIKLQDLRAEYVDVQSKCIDARADVFNVISALGGEHYNVLYSRYIEMNATGKTARRLGCITGAVNRKLNEGIKALIPVALAYGKIEYKTLDSISLSDTLYDCRMLSAAVHYAEKRLVEERAALSNERYIAIDFRPAWRKLHDEAIDEAQLFRDVYTIRANESAKRVEKMLRFVGNSAQVEMLKMYYIECKSVPDIASATDGFSQKQVESVISEGVAAMSSNLRDSIKRKNISR